MIFMASLAGNLIVFLVDILLSNILGPVDFGVFRTIFYLFSFIPVAIELGINATITKYVAEFKGNKAKTNYLVRWFLKLKVVSYSIMMCVAFVFREQIAALFLGDASLSYLVLPGILLSGMMFFLFFQFLVLGFQKFRLFALSQFLTVFISALLGVALSGLGTFYIILGWSFGFLIGNAFNIRFFFKNIGRKTESFDIKKIFMKFSLPLYVIGILVALLSIIVPILSLFFPQESIGYLSFALLFYTATLLIPNAIASVVFPKVSELNGLKRHGDAKNILRKAFLLYSMVVVMGLLAVFLLSDWMFNLLFVTYLPSLFMFKVLVGLGLIFGFNVIYTNYLQGLGRVKLFGLLVLVQNAILFAVSFMLLSA